MDADLAQRYFLAAQESPGGWLIAGIGLRAAAERLDYFKYPARDDESPISFFSEYHLLVGLAFENILKGFITLVRMEQKEQEILPRECYIHKLEALATRPECAELNITDEEMAAFARLSPYIEWAGRYPHPRRASDMIAKGSSSIFHRMEQDLWDRITLALKERAWIMKGGGEAQGGYRLYTSPPTRRIE
ncbi:MAG: hypothetical protein JWQ01_2551 [Massilia sp.]|nr:hypothetical protein [Massilia sp.]